MTHRFRQSLARLWCCESGVALIEMAYSLPVLISLTVGGAELANYATVAMRVSQLALQVADNASRIGEGSPLAAKKISETQINDILEGADAQAGGLNILGSQTEDGVTHAKARIIISDLEPVANPNTTNKYKIGWQRCKGPLTSYTPQYGTYGATSGSNMDGMGPTGRQVIAPDGTAVMFVEIRYRYKPLLFGSLAIMPYRDIDVVAAMIVRDDRDLTKIYNSEGATIATCTPPTISGGT